MHSQSTLLSLQTSFYIAKFYFEPMKQLSRPKVQPTNNRKSLNSNRKNHRRRKQTANTSIKQQITSHLAIKKRQKSHYLYFPVIYPFKSKNRKANLTFTVVNGKFSATILLVITRPHSCNYSHYYQCVFQ